MIISKTPLRISIGGGGTDLPAFYERETGFVLSAAIDKFIYIGVNATFTDDYFLKYAELERVARIDEVKHRIIKEVLDLLEIPPGVEIVSLADIPSGTGLGSSGSFTVGLLRALRAFRHHHVDTYDLAQQACHIEIDRLGEPVGKQDQFIAAYGGISCFDFEADGSVTVERLDLSDDTLAALEDHLLLFFTGYSRAASTMLQDQKDRTRTGDDAMIENLRSTKQLGLRIRAALEAGEPARFGEMMAEHWEVKRLRTSGISNPDIDRWYDAGIAAGAIGGKLVGAGAGGFLLFYASDPDRLRVAMKAEGLPEVRFRFCHDGSTISGSS